MLGNSTIRYICDAQHFNIIYLISYIDIFPFYEHYFHYKIYAIILISLHCTSGPSRCLLFIYLQYICRSYKPINRNYSRLVFDYIAYSAKNTGRRFIVVIYRHKGERDALIIILLLFFYCVEYRCTLMLSIVYIFTMHLSF